MSEYMEIMSAWADETEQVIEGFKSLFPSTTEGYMKFLFAVHYMALGECQRRNIPPEAFLQAVPSIVSYWHKAGRPEGVELLCLSSFDMEAIVERMKREQAGGEKPSSDA
jgi:hypothetical protein